MGQNFSAAEKGLFYYAVNYINLFLAGLIFLSCLYSVQFAIHYHLTNSELQTATEFFGSQFYRYSGEQRVVLLIEALKYQFWIFFCLLLRTFSLHISKWWSVFVSFLLQIGTIILVIIYYNWAQKVDEWSLMLAQPKWVLGWLIILLFVLTAVDLIILMVVGNNKPVRY